MTSRIYGSSDDLIEFDGDLEDEVKALDFSDIDDEGDGGSLIVCSDGTLLLVKYGKAKMAIWQMTVIVKGALFDRLEICADEDAEIHSDIAHFQDGLRWAYVASEWQRAG